MGRRDGLCGCVRSPVLRLGSGATRRRAPAITLALVSWLATLAAPTLGLAQSDPVIQKIVKTWKDREDRIRSFRIEWKEKVLWVAGSVAKPAPGAGDLLFPKEDVIQDYQRSLLVEGARVRYEIDGVEASNCSDIVGFLKCRTKSAFDGKNSKSFWDYEDKALHYPSGRVHPVSGLFDAREIATIPPLLAMRALHQEWTTVNLREYRPAQEVMVIDGEKCIALTFRGGPDEEERIYLAPQREYLPLRKERRWKGRTTSVWKVSFRDDHQHGWLPAAWEVAEFRSDGTFSEHRTSVVTSCAVNVPVRGEDFKIEFPEGTWVYDGLTKESYIQLSDGDNRRIVPGEKGKYADFLATKSGALLPRDRPRGAWAYVLVGIPLVVLAWMAVALARRRWSRSGGGPAAR